MIAVLMVSVAQVFLQLLPRDNDYEHVATSDSDRIKYKPHLGLILATTLKATFTSRGTVERALLF